MRHVALPPDMPGEGATWHLCVSLCCLFWAAMALAATGPDRMPPIPEALMTEKQRAAAWEFEQSRGVPVFGPFVPLLRSPNLFRAANSLGQFVRYKSSLPSYISELIILITAREWSQQVEWAIHQPIGLRMGLSEEVVAAIAEGRRPEGMPEDVETAWKFSTEVQREREVKDETYRRAMEVFGEEGVMDMLGVNGYYTTLAMVMNVARTPPPDSAVPPLKPLQPDSVYDTIVPL